MANYRLRQKGAARALLDPQPIGRGSGGLHRLRATVLAAVAEGRALAEVALLLSRGVSALAPGCLCTIIAVRDGQLHPLAMPGLPAAFADAVEGVPIGPEVLCCGRAAFLDEEVSVTDLRHDPKWTGFAAFPQSVGFSACWSTPVRDRSGAVIAALALFFAEERGPTARERRAAYSGIELCAVAFGQADALARLQRTNERFGLALSHMSQGLCFFGPDQRLIVANRQYSEMYSLPVGRVVAGMTLREVLALREEAGTAPVMPIETFMEWREALRTAPSAPDTAVELSNGQVIALHHQTLPDGGWVSTHEDITARRRAEAQIVHMARHDSLTGLPTRVLFHERLDRALAFSSRGQECAVLCADLDDFKAVNDRFGHHVGDRLLQGVTERFIACVREVDTVGRLGGDEFAVLLVGIDRPESAGEIANRIVRAVREPFTIDGHTVVIGASIGIAIAPRDGSLPGSLLKSADTALYRAKTDERGHFRFFEPDMDKRLQQRVKQEQDLRDALRLGQFVLEYQPLYNLESNAICGFEALIRWAHPAGGLVPPCDFIPLAEEIGLIGPIGAWVLEEACAEAVNWPAPLKVAVNLSAIQFRDATLLRTVNDALSSSGLPATRLELEITESVILKQSADTMATLHTLRAMGVSISLDDFGTGYSSLSYLRTFPFDKIKIDQSFVRDVAGDGNAIAIARAVVGLGRSLGMVTTAEGVETNEQLEQLRREGCTEVQGFLFSRPVGADEARALAHAPDPKGRVRRPLIDDADG